MKKVTLLFLLMLVSVRVFAGGFKNAGDFNVLGILVNFYQGHYERALSDDISLKVGIGFSPNFVWVTGISILDAYAEGRYYLSGLLKGIDLPDVIAPYLQTTAVEGLFVGVGGGLTSLTWDYSYFTTYIGKAITFRGGIEVGYKYVRKDWANFFIEPYAGFLVETPAVWSWKDANGNDYNWVSGAPTSTYSRGGFDWGIGLGFVF